MMKQMKMNSSQDMNRDIIANSDYIISLGSMLSRDNEAAEDAVLEAIAKNNAEFIYMHPIDDVNLKLYYTQFVKYEVGSEEGICSLLIEYFTNNRTEDIENFVNDLDIGYISAESSAGEEEFEDMVEKAKDKKSKTIIFGDDIFTHERVENISRLIKIFKEYTDFNIVVLSSEYASIIENSNKSLDEVDDLKSYNGTVIYNYVDEKDSSDTLLGSNSFARVAKVNDGDKIIVNFKNEKSEKTFKVDKNLQGTIALCAMGESENNWISDGYRYKQVKIEKVDA